ncbi:hypothetical protein Q8A73_023800 [Channa argus]|nr:hypothetical protein Q8A73_023800 [Channa argus]
MLPSLGKNIQGSCSTAWVKTSRAWFNTPLPSLMLPSLGKNIQGLGSCSTAWVKTSRAWVNSPLPRLMLHSLGSCSTAWVKTSRAWFNTPLPRLMLHSLGSCSTAWVKTSRAWFNTPLPRLMLHSLGSCSLPWVRTSTAQPKSPSPGPPSPTQALFPQPWEAWLHTLPLPAQASRTLPTIRTCVPTLKHPSPGYTPPSAAPRVSCPWYRKLNSVPLVLRVGLCHFPGKDLFILFFRAPGTPLAEPGAWPTIRTCVPTLKHPSPGYTPPSAAPRVSCPWYRKLNSVPLKDPGGEREAIRARGPVSGASLPPCPRLGGWDSVAFLKVFCGRAPGTPAWGEGVGGARAHGRQKLGSRADFQ